MQIKNLVRLCDERPICGKKCPYESLCNEVEVILDSKYHTCMPLVKDIDDVDKILEDIGDMIIGSKTDKLIADYCRADIDAAQLAFDLSMEVKNHE